MGKIRVASVIWIAFAGILLSAGRVGAAENIDFSQRILPVRFVYLDEQGQAKRSWSNVQNQDAVYVFKIFDNQGRELSLAEGARKKSLQEVVSQTVIERKKSEYSTLLESGSALREVKTVV